MKLTKYDRESFVRAVMDDIPKIDYMEQVRAIVLEDSIKQLPTKLQDAARDEKCKSFLEMTSYYGRDFGNSFSAFGHRYSSFAPSKDAMKRIDELTRLYMAQKAKRDAVEAKLTATIQACSTLKVAIERLPEFVTYLPEDRSPAPGAYLPAVANLVSDLATLGWPISKTETKASAKRGNKAAVTQ